MSELKRLRIDIGCLVELNIHWRKVAARHRLEERTLGWFEAVNINSAYYQNYSSGPSQAGGVSLWAMNKASHRVMEVGRDLRGLGRWTWTRFRGKNEKSLRVIAAYRPNLNETGPNSVWGQQRDYFIRHNRDEDPRVLFTSDLVAEINMWKEQGDQIVVALCK